MVEIKGLENIKRARGHRLYGQSGKKYIDLYQWNGRGILGHRPGKMLTRLKNAISQGLSVSVPSRYHNRLVKLCSTVCPAYHAYFVESLADGIIDPVFVENPDSGTSFWRPWLKQPKVDTLIPVLPTLGLCSKYLVFSKQPLQGVAISPIEAEILIEGLRLFAGMLIEDVPSTGDLLESPYWIRKGHYFKIQTENYEGMQKLFLERGFILPPTKNYPMIAPLELSSGEALAFQRACSEWEV